MSVMQRALVLLLKNIGNKSDYRYNSDFRLPRQEIDPIISAMLRNPFTSSSLLNDSSLSTTPSQVIPNLKWILKARPSGLFNPESDVDLVKEDLVLSANRPEDDTSTRHVPEDHVVVKVAKLSVDAFVRTMLDEEAHHGSVPLGHVVPALGYGTVVYAGSATYRKVGSSVVGLLGAQQYACVPSSQVTQQVKFPFLSPSSSLGLMGLTTGLTAYVGSFYVLPPPKRGQTVVVTGAAGAVGSIAAQLFKTTGARVIGVAGGTEKQQYLLNELKLDGAIDYKSRHHSISAQLNEVAPNGIDFIFDNVGGDILDTLLAIIQPGAKVVICGAISQYSGNLNKGKVQGPSNYLKLAEQGATMKGFVVTQYMLRLPFAIVGMLYFYVRGFVSMREHVELGLESFPKALAALFTGDHIGKLLVNVSDD
jgi:NADPH-dependent curcumin reductase